MDESIERLTERLQTSMKEKETENIERLKNIQEGVTGLDEGSQEMQSIIEQMNEKFSNLLN
jgi:hypothetical protein